MRRVYTEKSQAGRKAWCLLEGSHGFFMTIPAPANVVDMVPNQSECSVQSRGKWNGTTALDKAG